MASAPFRADILTNDPGFEPWVEATEVKLDKVEYDIKKTGQAEKFSALQSSEPHHITNHPQSPLLTYPTYLTFLHSLLRAYYTASTEPFTYLPYLPHILALTLARVLNRRVGCTFRLSQAVPNTRISSHSSSHSETIRREVADSPRDACCVGCALEEAS